MLTEYSLAAPSLDMPSSQSFKARSCKSSEYARPINSSVKKIMEKQYDVFYHTNAAYSMAIFNTH
jgi:hypothetical protein